MTERLTMTISNFAEASGISRGLAYTLAAQNKLPVPVIRIGRRMLLSRAAVEALLAGKDSQNANH